MTIRLKHKELLFYLYIMQEVINQIEGYEYNIGWLKGFHITKKSRDYESSSPLVKLCGSDCDVVSFTEKTQLQEGTYSVNEYETYNAINWSIPRMCDTISNFNFVYDTKKNIQFFIPKCTHGEKHIIDFTVEKQFNMLNGSGLWMDRLIIEVPKKYSVTEVINELEISYICYIYTAADRSLLGRTNSNVDMMEFRLNGSQNKIKNMPFYDLVDAIHEE